MNLRSNRLEAAVLMSVAAIGLAHLPYPFHGDSNWFTYVAMQLRDGSVLYRDVWDAKQPGIFLFYLTGGSVFGFDEPGIHLFELVYWFVFSTLLICFIRPRVTHRWAAALAPLLTVGAYYASVIRPSQLTQVEALVAFPMLATLWLILPSQRDLARPGPVPGRWFLSGLAGGLVLLGKFMFLPIVTGLWLLGLWWAHRGIGRSGWFRIGRAVTALAVGAAVPILALTYYLARYDVLDLAVWTYFSYPPAARGITSPPALRLAKSLAWFGVMFSPLVVLAAGYLLKWRWRRPDPLATGLVVWLAIGLAVLGLQLWWSYHFMLLVVPLGILACLGIDAWADRLRDRRSAIIALVILALPLFGSLSFKVGTLVSHRFAMEPEDRLRYQAVHWRPYGDLVAVLKDLEFLAGTDAHEGPIYVYGDPVMVLHAGRPQASSIGGWGPEMWIPSMWMQVAEDIRAAHTPYIFVQTDMERLILNRSHETQWLLSEEYDVLADVPHGVWYVRR